MSAVRRLGGQGVRALVYSVRALGAYSPTAVRLYSRTIGRTRAKATSIDSTRRESLALGAVPRVREWRKARVQCVVPRRVRCDLLAVECCLLTES